MSFLTEREKPSMSVSCSLTSTSIACADAKPLSVGHRTPCEYLKKRSAAHGNALTLPVQIGKHGFNGHCCGSPRNSSQLRRFLEENSRMETEDTCEVNDALDEVDCDMTGCGQKRSTGSGLHQASELSSIGRNSCHKDESDSCRRETLSKCLKICDENNNSGGGEVTNYFQLTKSVHREPVISCLDELVQELHRVFQESDVNVDYVEMVMRAYKSNPRDWAKYAKFDRFKYTRNLVDAGNDKFNLMILCWGEGHGSSVHDHADAHCFMKMLDGSLTETRFAWPQGSEEVCDNVERPLEVISKTQLKLNDVCYINDSLGLHRVENCSYADRAVSLHLYCPPFDACSVFNEKTGRKTVSKVTFWSKFGKRNKEGLSGIARQDEKEASEKIQESEDC